MITPNRLTAFRILLAFVTPLLVVWNRVPLIEIIATILFTVACITDWWDGHLARTKSMVTVTGKIIDPIADKLLILGLMATFSFFKLYSFWWVLLILIREVAVTWARMVRLKHGKAIPAEWAGKIKMGFQIASIYSSLLFLIALDSGLNGSFLFVLRLLHYCGISMANVVTVISGILFFNRLNKT